MARRVLFVALSITLQALGVAIDAQMAHRLKGSVKSAVANATVRADNLSGLPRRSTTCAGSLAHNR